MLLVRRRLGPLALRGVDAQLTFVQDAAGKVTHLILHQGGIDRKGTKVR
jgi:hypothetical protein